MTTRCDFHFPSGNRCQGLKGHDDVKEGHHWQGDREIVIEGVPTPPSVPTACPHHKHPRLSWEEPCECCKRTEAAHKAGRQEAYEDIADMGRKRGGNFVKMIVGKALQERALRATPAAPEGDDASVRR